MELANTAIVGLFFGMSWALIKVVEFFVKKYSKNSKEKLIELTYQHCEDFNKYGVLTEEQIKKLDDIHNMLYHLNELNSLPDKNYIPEWYVPREILSLLKKIYHITQEISVIIKSMSDAEKNEQDEKISELIEIQKDLSYKLNTMASAWIDSFKKQN